MDYDRDISIDENGLDVEWLQQPRLMLAYTRHAAQTKMEVDLAKENLEVTEAGLDSEIRSAPDAFRLSKITETVVQNTIILQPEYKTASKRYIEAKYEYEMAVAAVRAIDQKKGALEALVRLHSQQYFAGPSVPRDLGKEWEAKQNQKKTDQQVAGKLQRKRG